jgi:hypothetical protein
MKDNKFRQRVQDELRKVPLAERKTWDGHKVFAWWMGKVKDDPTLTYGAGRGDHWQHAHSAAMKMYGADAVI